MGKREYRFIDMHCHLLPKVDDGSQSVATTMEMLDIAAKEGIREIIVTPHYKMGHNNASPDVIKERIALIQDLIDKQGMDIKLYPGNELYYFDGCEDMIEERTINTLNNTDRVLVEFSPMEEYKYIRNALNSLRSMDLVPILAHVERYECMLKHIEYVEELVNLDIEIQINAGSIAGKTGHKIQKYVFKLLKEGLVSYVGTDSHNTEGRAPVVKKALDIMYKKLDEDYVDEIVYYNAYDLIH